MTGYQQGILWASGCYQHNRFAVRNVDKHYIDAIKSVFPGNQPYLQKHNTKGKKDYWVIKSAKIKQISLSDVAEMEGFITAIIELNSCASLGTRKRRDGTHYYRPILRIYGTVETLDFIKPHLPIKPKKTQKQKTNTGTTYYISIASAKELDDIYNFCEHKNKYFWDRFNDLLDGKLNDKDHPWI